MADLTPEHTARQHTARHPDIDSYSEVIAAYRYVQSVISTADAQSPVGGYAWHGWALREAFLAGCTYVHSATSQHALPADGEAVLESFIRSQRPLDPEFAAVLKPDALWGLYEESPAAHGDSGQALIPDSCNKGLLPMIVSATGDPNEPELERIICSSISGGADYLNGMPRELSLQRITAEGSVFARYIQGPRSPELTLNSTKQCFTQTINEITNG